MNRQLVFEVVGHYPEKPYEANWNGTSWEIMGGDGLIWQIGGDASDAVNAATARGEAANPNLERILAVALHSDAAVASVKGGTDE
ncbi:MAG: hypothetical protein ACOC9P_02290 [bacterium]